MNWQHWFAARSKPRCLQFLHEFVKAVSRRPRQEKLLDLHLYDLREIDKRFVVHVREARFGFGNARIEDFSRAIIWTVPDLAHVVTEAVFNIPWLVKAASYQCFDSILSGGSPERSDARIPTGAEFDIRWKACVDQALGSGDRPFIEPGDPGCERVYKRV